MKRRHSARVAVLGLLATIGLVAAACAPSTGGTPTPVNWSFKGTNVKVDASQDGVYLFGSCIAIPNCKDEPYLYQVAFRVKIGEPNSAQTFVVKGDEMASLGVGESHVLSPGEQAKVTFSNVAPLDVLDALKPSNKMEIVGTYTWAAESDLINSLGTGANGVAAIFKDALNSTLASATLPNGDTNALVTLILNLLFNNIGSAFGLIASNIPCLGLCDDVLGGAVYIGIGATGTLGSLIDTALSSATIPSLTLIGDNSVPPNIVGGGLYTLTGAKNFHQPFNGAGGQHTYDFTAGPA
jgi:hypothetical protein